MGKLLSAVPLGYRVLALAALCAALIGYGWLKGAESGEARLDDYKLTQDKAVHAQVVKAAAKTKALQDAADKLKKDSNAKNHSVDYRLTSALDWLQDRPDRRPDLPAVAGTCAGVSGSQLARGDAEFLARYAADAARLNIALEQCRSQYDQGRQALRQPP